MWNSSGKVQKSCGSQCEECVVDDTASVHTAETRQRLGRWRNVYIRAPFPGAGAGPAEQLGILQQTWKSSPIYRPARLSPAVFSWSGTSCQSKSCFSRFLPLS